MKRNNRRWTTKEVEFLKNNYTDMSQEELAEKLGRTPAAIAGKEHHLRLIRTPIYAIYKGDNFIMTGTKQEIAEHLGISENTVSFYMSRSYQKRCVGGNCKRVVKIGYE